MNSSTESLCRICLGDGATIPIFEDLVDENGCNYSIQDKLALCLNAQFKDVAGYPLCICSCCHDTLNIMFDFINKYKETSRILEERLKVVVKQEYIEYEDHDVFIYPEDEDNSFDAFKPDIIEKDIKIKFEDGANLIENIITHSHKKATKKMGIRKDITNKKTTIKKPKNMIRKNKINKRASSLSDRENEDSTLHSPKAIKKPSCPVLCESCGETFMSHEKLKLHEEQKHKSITLVCTTCKKTFATHLYLKKHIKRNHSDAKDFICSKCGKGFAFVGDLNMHTKCVHEKIRRKIHKRLPCKWCDKDFITKKLLLTHERAAHTGERPAVCTVCDKSFFHEDYLKEHMRLHTGQRPFECPVCGRGYAQRGNMKSHMRNHRISELDKETLSKIKTSWHRFMKP